MTLRVIQPDLYRVWFEVQTPHDGLEFVLTSAEIRNNKDYRFYGEQLRNMLVEEAKKYDKRWFHVESEAYGSIRECIEVDDLKNLPEALAACDKVVQKWLAKYNILEMK